MGLSKKKVEPQFGVSFGLPYPTGAYPLNPFNGGSPAQNPYFGAISPNGLNLGLVNVNPLVSFQFAKNEYGEKLFKPLVNLHVTPNENIINKVGSLFKGKKHGSYGHGQYGSHNGLYNQHYHTHTHFPASPPIYHPHHYESGHHHYAGGSEYYGSGPGGYGFSGPGGYSSSGAGGGYGFSGPGSSYAGGPPSGPAGYYGGGDEGFYPSGPNDFNNGFYSRSLNATQGFTPSTNDYQNVYPNNQQYQTNDIGNNGYASNYNDYNSNNPIVPNQSNENRPSTQSQSVSFPSSRRKRSSGNDNDDKSNLKNNKIEKVR